MCVTPNNTHFAYPVQCTALRRRDILRKTWEKYSPPQFTVNMFFCWIYSPYGTRLFLPGLRIFLTDSLYSMEKKRVENRIHAAPEGALFSFHFQLLSCRKVQPQLIMLITVLEQVSPEPWAGLLSWVELSLGRGVNIKSDGAALTKIICTEQPLFLHNFHFIFLWVQPQSLTVFSCFLEKP